MAYLAGATRLTASHPPQRSTLPTTHAPLSIARAPLQRRGADPERSWSGHGSRCMARANPADRHSWAGSTEIAPETARAASGGPHGPSNVSRGPARAEP